MPKIIILPHIEICPNGEVIDAKPGLSICENLLQNQVCACTTCHVIIREGFETLNQADDLEEDLLDKAWGLEPKSRLSCQAIVDQHDLTIEIPRYTINMAKEG
jgi:2Fe-2S ferredoxin